MGESWSLVSTLKRNWEESGLIYSEGIFHMDFDMTGSLLVSAVRSLHNHTWLPCHGSQSRLLKISGSIPDPFLFELYGFGLWFPGKGNLSF